MSVTSNRNIDVSFTGDIVSSTTFSAVENDDSPSQVQVVTLASGNNTITAPASGTTPTACTILKPAGNAVAITLKGVAGDTGVALHLTDPDSISIASSVVSFVLNAGAQIDGVRLIWT